MALMMAYGAYIPSEASLLRSAVLIVASIVLVSLLATLVIFPLAFRYHLDPAQGPKLIFEVLPTAFAEMPAGRLFGTSFFALLGLAALTPAIGTLEPVVAWLCDRGFRRRNAVLAAGAAGWCLGLGSVLSFNVLANWHPLGALPLFGTRTFFYVVDFVSANLLLPIGALLTSVFVGWRLPAPGTAVVPGTTRIDRRLIWLLRYVCPIAILGVLISAFV